MAHWVLDMVLEQPLGTTQGLCCLAVPPLLESAVGAEKSIKEQSSRDGDAPASASTQLRNMGLHWAIGAVASICPGWSPHGRPGC